MHSSVRSREAAFYPWIWLRKREEGIYGNGRKQSNCCDGLKANLYSCIKPLHTWDPSKSTDDTHHGGIFNFDFSPQGSILAAACEGKSILLFDPLTGKLIERKNGAHSDCVNCVKFLDTRILATCSDDTTISLWDIRHLKHQFQCLQGHSSWVKNIEYCPKRDLLMSSGFDGCIYTWDINSFCEEDTKGKKILSYKSLMRTKLSPDGTKLFISTEHGSIFIIHDLYLPTLSEDLKSIRPFGFRDIIERKNSEENAQEPRTRNRPELIHDWPQGNKASVIASLQVHPQGWCVLSRNTSGDRNSEWTCIHDAQDYKSKDEEQEARSIDPSQPSTSCSPSSHTTTNTTAQSGGRPEPKGQTTPTQPPSQTANFQSQAASNSESTENRTGRLTASVTFSFVLRGQRSGSQQNRDTTANRDDDTGGASNENSDEDENDDGPEVEDDDEEEDEDQDSTSENQNQHTRTIMNSEDAQRAISDILTIVFGSGSRRHVFRFNHYEPVFDESLCDSDSKSSRKRLLYYTEEPNVGRGFIKELCFNSDGTLVCSPFGYGIRLLAFDPNCRELCDVVPNEPVKLYEVGTSMAHRNNVVTCKFSPTHCLLVSGCLNGRVTFHQPVL